MVVLLPVPEAVGQSWRMLVHEADTFAYLPVRTNTADQQAAGWRGEGFNDAAWKRGAGGIGFGDGDDRTIIPQGNSVYLRKWFQAGDPASLSRLMLMIDYDDGFVAYINGHEVARANIDPQIREPRFNVTATASREALMYQGGYPAFYLLDSAACASLLVPGQNLLAVQVHNRAANSDDLSSIIYLLSRCERAGESDRDPPPWFADWMQGTSSTLPLVMIETGGWAIPDPVRIPASMKIITPEKGLSVTPLDDATDYNGRISIEKRGHSSQFMFPDGKHSYGLETQDAHGENLNMPILGMPKENDWILNGPYSDKTLIRNVVVFHFGRRAGLLTPRTRHVNLRINGEEQGLYVWMEKIKQDKNRVDIARLSEADTAGDALTGGYIVKVDWPNNVPNEGWISPHPPNNGTGQETVFVMQDPKPGEILPVQLDYIRTYVTAFENALLSEGFTHPDEGYRRYIEFSSWVNFFIISELFRDTDAYRCSLYMFKDRDSKGGKLTMGPLWDYNYSMGNYDNFNVFKTEGWAYLFNYDCNTRAKINPFWYERLMQDTLFVNAVRTRWDELRSGALHTDSLMQFIDQLVEQIHPSAIRNFEIWPVLNTYLWPNYYVGGSYDNEIAWVKNWLSERAAWIDVHLPGRNTSGLPVVLNPDYARLHVHPNPFNASLHLRFEATRPGAVTFVIENLMGRQVAEVISREPDSGVHQVEFQGGSALPAGVYLVRVVQNNRQLAVTRIVKAG